MQIRRYLPEAAFEPAVVEAMGVAFDEACQALNLKDEPTFLKEVLARKIVELAQHGESDAKELRDRAILALGGKT
jgi:hypothetical protein